MKKIWQKIQAFFIKLFGGLKKFEKFVLENMGDITVIVGQVLKFAGTPIIGSIISLLSEKLSNQTQEAQDKIIDVLTKAIIKLEISTDCLEKQTQGEIILCFLQEFGKRSKKDQEGTAAKLASTMLQVQSEMDLKTPLKDSQADTLAQNYFFAKKIDILDVA